MADHLLSRGVILTPFDVVVRSPYEQRFSLARESLDLGSGSLAYVLVLAREREEVEYLMDRYLNSKFWDCILRFQNNSIRTHYNPNTPSLSADILMQTETALRCLFERSRCMA